MKAVFQLKKNHAKHLHIVQIFDMKLHLFLMTSNLGTHRLVEKKKISREIIAQLQCTVVSQMSK